MRWKLKTDVIAEAVVHLQEVLKVDKIIAQLLVQRGISTYNEAKDFFRPSLDALHDPFLMKDMDKSIVRIKEAVQNNEKILIYGDYDVDGTTSVAMLASFFKGFYPNVDTYIPDRYSEGYGVSYQGIDYASQNDVKLIISIDCGIKSVDEIAYAQELDIDFIVCDHHLPGEILPQAKAVLDPKRSDCNYPFKELCGCGVGFKLIQAYSISQQRDIKGLVQYLDLVATAIVADVVPMTGENRIMAYYGLEVINKTPRPGLRALLSSYDQSSFTISDIVFKIAPKINAAGRLEHGKFAVELLSTSDYTEAIKLAKYIMDINSERKHIDQQITEQALQMIVDNKEVFNKSTVIYNPTWHKGVIGIVASRLIETYYRPTIVFTESGEYLAASARSVKNFDVYEAIKECSEYLIQFGGHKYAAGLTLYKENYTAFKEKFEEVVSRTLDERDMIPELVIDAEVDFSDLTPKVIRILRQFEPFGPDNEMPLFISNNIYDTGGKRLIGKNKEHMYLYVKQRGNEEQSFPVVAFRFGKYFEELNNRRFFNFVYSIEDSEWKGKVKTQLVMKDMQLV
ncbi:MULTISPECIES: single-stranded-DNA-specific exonuclease RecJ [Myroides]|uniref:Single-stranded-DNA-specific exonuclease RecJ n=1 Tax=Myroides albus TaxID=2562892 RepID=A0A6I3LKQ9_9FLAO|nr:MULTISPECIES: single-stranded-DNA-specific exonuclease RecJ [Myroides]MTG96752.1 single-stranded-DNA-specific exonuclease RecJ [Myroides albus]MVX35606.1 single-stranded-DNA-specific exonuclease RecJ [Myroides sp. LoEW2-1]UVD80837.1 single-stranded-DNA-specific exonuclease RecJ [Myroides albus]